jgi:hydroxyethylthiazole kinase-like sugar kinase family protein
VVVTGKDDVISDGTDTVIISNGNHLLGKITGVSNLVCVAKQKSGCSLGSVIGACVAIDRSNKFLAALTAYELLSIKIPNLRILLYSIASEYAAEKPGVAGPGSFIPAFLDTLSALTAGDTSWIDRANITLWTE